MTTRFPAIITFLTLTACRFAPTDVETDTADEATISDLTPPADDFCAEFPDLCSEDTDGDTMEEIIETGDVIPVDVIPVEAYMTPQSVLDTISYGAGDEARLTADAITTEEDGFSASGIVY